MSPDIQSERGDARSLAERVYEQVRTLPEPLAREVLDFVGFLAERSERREWRDVMDAQTMGLASVWYNADDRVWDDA